MRGLLCDFGGVLTTNVFDSFREFCTSEGLDRDALKTLFRSEPEFVEELRKLERGELAEADFCTTLASWLGIPRSDDLIDRIFAGMQPDQQVIGAVGRAHAAGVATGLISNSWSTGHYDREALAQLFDTVVISADVGLHKPEPDIYLLGAERIAVDPTACVFVDDLRENCDGAEAVGMTAVLHRDSQQTVDKLERLFETSLR